MALARIPLPSFTFVLTSDPQSFHQYPTAIKLDSSSSPTMLPTTRDHLMQTIHLRDVPDDSIQNSLSIPEKCIDYDRIRLQTIFEEEELLMSPAVGKKQGAGTTKQYVLMALRSLRRKLFSAKGTVPVRRIIN